MFKRSTLLSLLVLSAASITSAQDIWSKVTSFPDTIFMGLGAATVSGDSIFIAGQTANSGNLYTHKFSPDAGATWQTLTLPAAPAFFHLPAYVQVLPANNLFLCNSGVGNVYKLGTDFTWSTYITQDRGAFADLGSNNILFYSEGWEDLFQGPADGSAFTALGIDFPFFSFLTVGNRLILGGSDGRMATIDNGNIATFTQSTMNPAPADIDRVYSIMRQPDGDLIALLGGFPDRISKSTDNGATWNMVATTYDPPDQYGLITGLSLTPSGDLLITSNSDTRVWKSTDDGATAQPYTSGIPDGNLQQVSMYHPLLTRNGTNFVGVRSVVSNGPPFLIPENSGLFAVESANAIIDLRTNNGMLAYPVPCADQLTVELPLELATIELIDALGRTTQRTSTNGGTTTLDLSGVLAGCYTLTVRSTNGISTARVVVE